MLVAIDLFSRYAFAVLTRDQTAETAARVLWREVFQRYGCPEKLLSDQGPAFESLLLRQLCTLYGCKKIRTTPYRPQGNGACERWNQQPDPQGPVYQMRPEGAEGPLRTPSIGAIYMSAPLDVNCDLRRQQMEGEKYVQLR
ncbi:hypothetical protein AALO_G00262840 [Alosa alosa]|uniref:Integrase catalytic domain-containing protein n=1 Tax=Alosa alosa TaxID=278164 RepID=A0AAV6FVD9_9TELE|nr:hypothetical protein AALO_G00262840 [Alosa alosa]